MKNHEVTETLQSVFEGIEKCIGTTCEDEVRAWLTAATLQIWASNKLVSQDYLQVLPALTKQKYTLSQISTAMKCVGEEGRTLEIPQFFRRIVESDIVSRRSNSRLIVDVLGRFLSMMALTNGDFTLAEAAALRKITEHLLEWCDEQGVIAGKRMEHHPEMITQMSNHGYYQDAVNRREETTKSTPFSPVTADHYASEERLESSANEVTVDMNIESDVGVT